MAILLRTIAIIIEVSLLTAIAYAVLKGVKLAVFDLGIGTKYSKAVTMVLIAVGLMVTVFFIAHLTSFYPAV